MGSHGAQAQARLGRYELLARLATGGMGEIFLARLEGAAGFEKLYVVKRILPHLADDLRFRQMLIGEARIASKMSHANICQVYELGETDGQLYIVMEYLEGVTLLPLLRRASKVSAPLDLGFVAGIVQQVTDGLVAQGQVGATANVGKAVARRNAGVGHGQCGHGRAPVGPLGHTRLATILSRKEVLPRRTSFRLAAARRAAEDRC